MPAEVRRQINPDRDAEHLARAKRRHDQAHDPAAHGHRENVRDDSKTGGTDHAAEEPGHDARGQERRVGRRQAAQERAEEEAGVKEQ